MSRYRKVNIAALSLLILLIIADLQIDIAWWWYFIALVFYLITCAIGAFFLSFELFLPVKCKGEVSDNCIAITFDDGPISGKTNRILEILARTNTPAAFFCIGSRIDKNESLLKAIDQGGHLVGNHTLHHKTTFGFLSGNTIFQELQDTDRKIEQVLQKKPRFFRPPFGVTNPMVAKAVSKGQYETIGWSIRSFDSIIHNAQKLLKRTENVKAGDIILFHDYSECTIEILPTLIETIRRKGFRIVRLDELLNEGAYR
jgi:peptidoglycan/xylan/chitin deacetylase (PgdA/CDA1 family)